MSRMSFKRSKGSRKPKVVWIACEGDVVEPRYLDGVKYYYRTRGVNLQIVEREESSPKAVLDAILKTKKSRTSNSDDLFWIIIDRDRWPNRMLSQVARQCSDSSIGMALSNPCFEFWQLLHYQDPEEEYNNCRLLKPLVNQLRVCKDENDYTNIDGLGQAIIRARNLDSGDGRWLNVNGSRMYLLIEDIISLAK
ncbi:MAG: RloB family protein [Cyclobacteriaceae bacterium]|nr:RloB family protein [Cyclobacteriaceae bacterium]